MGTRSIDRELFAQLIDNPLAFSPNRLIPKVHDAPTGMLSFGWAHNCAVWLALHVNAVLARVQNWQLLIAVLWMICPEFVHHYESWIILIFSNAVRRIQIALLHLLERFGVDPLSQPK